MVFFEEDGERKTVPVARFSGNLAQEEPVWGWRENPRSQPRKDQRNP